ncbi:MAG: hypothetical protein QNJ20_14160 [Paracoccaceae bacterium]|nr:hypothetical protein [Paracoccaceae bacterium]
MKDAFNVRHPFFRPFWRRALLTGVCLAWAVFELSNAQVIWALVFALAGGYLFFQFFVAFDPKDYEDHDTESR